MKLLLSLDYELFFGARVGTVERCLIEPMDALIPVLDRHGLKASLFVDAGFLVRLREESARNERFSRDWDLVRGQLDFLKRGGHDVQLHIHPHWEDTVCDGGGWRMDTKRYRLHDFSPPDMRRIVREYKGALTDLVGDGVFAFRAGGWCLQPFTNIADALFEEGIWLDSTVFHGGVSEDEQRWFDFSAAQRGASWRFGADPVREDPDGRFLEVPIGSFRVSPILFWRMLVNAKMGGAGNRSYGDGSAKRANRAYYLRRLTSWTWSVISLDGLRAGLLSNAYEQYMRNGENDLFHVMGHPKAMTPRGIGYLAAFLGKNGGTFEPVTFQDFSHMSPIPG